MFATVQKQVKIKNEWEDNKDWPALASLYCLPTHLCLDN